MHRLAVEALGGVKLQGAVGAHHVDGAHLRHHVGGDQDDDAVEARLGAHRLRHDLAEAAQEDARTAGSASHGEPDLLQGRRQRPVGDAVRPSGGLQVIEALSRPYSEWSVRTASSV